LTLNPVPGVGADFGSGGWLGVSAAEFASLGDGVSDGTATGAACAGGAEEAGGEETAVTLIRLLSHAIVGGGLSGNAQF
jgi:hypothetical protein